MPLFGNKTPVIPKEFLCPLSAGKEPMNHPVIFQGTTYERENITADLKRKGMSDAILIDNIRLNHEISE